MPVLLRHWREKRGLSVRGLAKLARVGFVTVSRVENGHLNPSVDLLEKLARALRVTVRELFPVGWPPIKGRAASRQRTARRRTRGSRR